MEKGLIWRADIDSWDSNVWFDEEWRFFKEYLPLFRLEDIRNYYRLQNHIAEALNNGDWIQYIIKILQKIWIKISKIIVITYDPEDLKQIWKNIISYPEYIEWNYFWENELEKYLLNPIYLLSNPKLALGEIVKEIKTNIAFLLISIWVKRLTWVRLFRQLSSYNIKVWNINWKNILFITDIASDIRWFLNRNSAFLQRNQAAPLQAIVRSL